MHFNLFLNYYHISEDICFFVYDILSDLYNYDILIFKSNELCAFPVPYTFEDVYSVSKHMYTRITSIQALRYLYSRAT